MTATLVSQRNILVVFALAYVSCVSLGEFAASYVKFNLTPTNKDAWKEIHNLIYSTDPADAMRPEELLAKLELLTKIYHAPLAQNMDMDEETRVRNARIFSLIQCSQTDLDSCNRASFKNLKEARQANSDYKVNVMPYLNYYTEKLFSNCFKNSETLVRSRMDTLSKTDKADAELLNQVLFGVKIQGHKLRDSTIRRSREYSHLLKGTIQFMSQKLSKSENYDWLDDETKYRELLDEHLIQVCSRFHAAVDPLIAMSLMDPRGRRLSDGVKRLIKLGGLCESLVIYNRYWLPVQSYDGLVSVIKSPKNTLGRHELLTKIGEGSSDIEHLYDGRFVLLRSATPECKDCMGAARNFFFKLANQSMQKLTAHRHREGSSNV